MEQDHREKPLDHVMGVVVVEDVIRGKVPVERPVDVKGDVRKCRGLLKMLTSTRRA